MEESFAQIINSNIPNKTKVVLAFSSGPDSVYLLHRLLKYQIEPILAHFNHELRDKESDKDEIFAKKIAKKYDLEYETDSQDIKKYAASHKLNLEQAAREQRYKFLEKVRKKHDATTILTAHHLNDNLETYLLNFLRGSSVNGQAGMKINNGYLLRPLLYTSKEQILKYLKKNKLKYRQDKSNNDPSFSRNFLRLKVIPQLEQLQPSLLKIFKRTWEQNSQLNEYLENSAQDWIKKHTNSSAEFKNSDLKKLNPAYRNVVIAQIYKHIYLSSEELSSNLLKRASDLIENDKSGKKITFGTDYLMHLYAGKIKFLPKRVPKKISSKKIALNGKSKFTHGEIITKLLTKTPQNLTKYIFLDVDKIKMPIMVRSWKNGDRMTPLGLKGSKKIQDIFTDKKIPQHERVAIPIITDKNDQIIAIGLNLINEKYKITKSTKHALKIGIKSHKPTLENTKKTSKL